MNANHQAITKQRFLVIAQHFVDSCAVFWGVSGIFCGALLCYCRQSEDLRDVQVLGQVVAFIPTKQL
ncbi:MAG: hypothetical protein QJT81_05305 [Candidatus Thiothrix putei]|uniref:Uncharacterized protein n=1 Tax=Candidatus Thiothrix putei TaxID=3080811 RepID=A0AA95KR91_9GAMM|nr:hypothetical protein [Thiothrix caldifontis]WGZ95403.1 MAG: hypothetical protein QJT81_05305 [Candidatus Thiothrix putei]